MKFPRRLMIGTRGSHLALVQAESIARQLRSLKVEVEIKSITTSGDRVAGSLAAAGGKGLFVKELEEALLRSDIDLAVHSLKDLPGELPKGLTLAGTPKREDPRDVLVALSATKLEQLPQAARIGTSSPRRKYQLLQKHPDFQIVPIRGNVDTRLQKLAKGEVDALILAAAGLHRLGRADVISSYLDPLEFIPAVGQGALALEVRSDDVDVLQLINSLAEKQATVSTTAERVVLRAVGGDCFTPLAAHATIQGEELHLRAFLATPDGAKSIVAEKSGTLSEAEEIGALLGKQLKQDL